MIPGAIEGKIQNTRRAFERLRDQMIAAPLPPELDLFEEVSARIEELEMAAEELREENDELAFAKVAVEARSQAYRDLFDQAPEGFVVTDGAGTIREVNRRVAAVLGVAQERLISKPLSIYVAAGDRRAFRRLVDAMRTAPGFRRALLHLQPRGRPPVRAVVEVGEVGRGRPEEGRLYWVIHDLSQVEVSLVEVESALAHEREAVERLRALDEMKNELVEDLSHDVRNPLTAILGFTSVLQGSDLDTDQSRDLLRRLGDNARKLERYLSQLLEFDHKTRGLRSVRREPTDVGALAAALASEWATHDRPVTVHAEPMTVEVESALVERILENLIVNALKHTPQHASVVVDVRRAGGGVAISVGDSGPGVSDNFKPRVFSRHFRLPGSALPGSGLGLHLVERFAQMHGGRVWVEDKEPSGASFRVFLPGREIAGAGRGAAEPAQKSRDDSSGTA
jgi:PAS domain S-box-containing protein